MSHTNKIQLDDGNYVLHGDLPESLWADQERFAKFWSHRPLEPLMIKMHGRWVAIPRRQKAHGHGYKFSGQEAEADPVSEWLRPYHQWARETIDNRFNGLLVNCYDKEKDEYIGPHHDASSELIVGSPILTVSLGEERIFRLHRFDNVDGKTKVATKQDLVAHPNTFIVLPWATNLAWKHSVPKLTRYHGRRVSITLRCFQ